MAGQTNTSLSLGGEGQQSRRVNLCGIHQITNHSKGLELTNYSRLIESRSPFLLIEMREFASPEGSAFLIKLFMEISSEKRKKKGSRVRHRSRAISAAKMK